MTEEKLIELQCPQCKHLIPATVFERSKAPFGKATASCSFCGIKYGLKDDRAIELLKPIQTQIRPEPILAEEAKALPIVFRKAELITS